MESSEQNPYSPPEADLQTINTSNLIENIPRFSAWGVFGLTVITFGIYYVYWLFTRTKILNKVIDDKISMGLAYTVIGLLSVNFTLSFMSGMDPGNTDLVLASNLVNLAYAIANLFWVFTFRNRIHQITNADKEQGYWLGGIMTFFFQVIYLQYKINEYIDNSKPSE